MAFGLQVSNAASQLTLDTSSRLPRFIGVLSSNQLSGSLYVPEIGDNNGTAIFLERALPNNINMDGINGPFLYFPMNLSYSYPYIYWNTLADAPTEFPSLIWYGYY